MINNYYLQETSIHGWMDKAAAVQKKGNLAICDKKSRPWGHYAKWNKSRKDIHYMILLLCGICLKKKNKLERDQICGYRAGVRNPMEKHNQKVQTPSYKISTQDVMYSMRKWMLTKLTVVIISQYILSENILLYTLNLHKLYMSIYISTKLKKD